MSSTKFQLNFTVKDLEENGLRVLKLIVVLQHAICEENGEYVLVTEDHKVIWAEKRRFKEGDQFPDERGWTWVGE